MATSIEFRTEKIGWITPTEQLERLFEPFIEEVAKEVAGTRENPGALPVFEVALIVGKYVVENISPHFTNWYTVLNQLKLLPEKLPPLPCHIHLILGQLCPIRAEERKEDGSRYKVSDTHSLYLLPAGTLNELEECVSAYGKEHLDEYGGRNPLRFCHRGYAARQQYGEIRSSEPQWILITKDILAESRNKHYVQQARVITDLGTRVFMDYKIPWLKETVTFVFFHKIVTGESILQAAKEKDQNIYTRLEETIWGRHLVIGGFCPDGLAVGISDCEDTNFGVMAVRRF